MRDNDSKKSKIILIIIAFILIVGILSGVLSTIETLSPGNGIGRGVVYSICTDISLITLFILPLPCIVCSIIGTYLAWKAYRNKDVCHVRWIAIGIADLFLSSLLFALLIFATNAFMMF